MIMTVEKAREYVNFPEAWTDEKIELKLKAIEQTIRKHTNNNFQNRAYRSTADIIGGLFVVEALNPFEVGDTVMISYGKNKGVFTVTEADDTTFIVEEDVVDDSNLIVTKVVYPADVLDCCISLLEWEIKYRDKVGIQSETLSRHSVTYVQQTGSNTVNGYPVSLMSGLKHYKKARY